MPEETMGAVDSTEEVQTADNSAADSAKERAS